MKTWDTKEAFLLTLKNTKRNMTRVPVHLRERALGMLQGGMRTADVARAIHCNVHTVRSLKQSYRQTGQAADHPFSGRPRVTSTGWQQQLPELLQEHTIPPSVLRLSAIG